MRSKNIPFEVKWIEHLTPIDLERSSAWAGYYAPDDLDLLVPYGYDRDEMWRALERVAFSEDYFFPIPSEPVEDDWWMRGTLSAATIETASGHRLPGFIMKYSSSRYLTLMHAGLQFAFDPGHGEYLEEMAHLDRILPGAPHFPMQVRNRISGEVIVHPWLPPAPAH